MTIRRSVAGVLLVATLALASGLTSCSKAEDPWKGHSDSPRVVVTFPPLYSFVKGVAPKAAVLCLCTDQGPHHYEASHEDAQKLQKADLFFANGLGLDDKFADAIQAQSHNPNLKYVKLGNLLPDSLKHREEHEEGEKKEEGKKEEHHHEGEWDPHVWLGIPQAIAMVKIIRDRLKEVDGGKAAEYDANADRTIKQLEALRDHGRKTLADKKDRNLISFHDSLGYFADPNCFDLNIVEAIEMAPGDEVTAVRLKELIEKGVEKKVHVIALEPQYPRNTSAEKLRQALEGKGLKVSMVVVDPLETASAADLKKEGEAWYDRKMRENVDNLAKALP